MSYLFKYYNYRLITKQQPPEIVEFYFHDFIGIIISFALAVLIFQQFAMALA